jgi:hypothetical protein
MLTKLSVQDVPAGTARVFELRARRDLARIYIRDGKADAAGALLKGGISLFAKELSFPDLQESRNLLHNL